MTAGSSQFVEFVKERLSALPSLATTRFFGGVGISSGGIQFAMVMDGAAYFVVNDDTRSTYERIGSECFSYKKGRGRVNVRRYYSVPAEVLEDEERLLEMARKAIVVANASSKRATKRQRPSRKRKITRTKSRTKSR